MSPGNRKMVQGRPIGRPFINLYFNSKYVSFPPSRGFFLERGKPIFLE